MSSLKELLSLLLLSSPVKNFQGSTDSTKSVYNPILQIVKGRSSELLKGSEYDEILHSKEAQDILSQYPSADLFSVLNLYIDHIRHLLSEKFGDDGEVHFHILAIAFFQTFIQLNFTGPGIEYDQSSWFTTDKSLVQLEALKLLTLQGQLPYGLMVDPIFFIISSIMFEKLMNIGEDSSLVSDNGVLEVEKLLKKVENFVSIATNINDTNTNDTNTNDTNTNKNAFVASICWWRSRLLQVHLSLFSEPVSIITSLCTLLLVPEMVNHLCGSQDKNVVLQKNLQIIFYLETARFGIHSQTEHLTIPLLGKARTISDLQLVVTGARAKRTKYQQFFTSNMIVLAQSKPDQFYDNSGEGHIEDFDLNSDVLLERPHFESLENVEIPDEPNTKRIRFNPSIEIEDDGTERLIPIAINSDDIPENLKQLDPNNQPPLNDLDNIQLLLRLTTLRQTSPAQNPLVEEELMALISRILFVDSKNVAATNTNVTNPETTNTIKPNWLIFSRSLWERSLSETTKAKTIERGILQMTSLIEEIGIKIKSRIMPQAMEADGADGSHPSASRLRFIHQMTLMPQWLMDTKLAEKYMSIGVLRSALEIYQRLEMWCEVALCYAAVDNEAQAEKVLLDRIQKHPEDARAISILGDLRQDPVLWQKAWEIGRYYRAKASLSQYYYSPPPVSGLSQNLNLAIQHMNDCLKQNPLSYENWFFYGCCGLESEQYELAAEAFSRCVALDDTNSHAWSNLATALLKSGKVPAAFNALKKALRSASDNKGSWKIYENYLIVAMKLHEWNDVLIATRELIGLKGDGERSIDIPAIEKLIEILVGSEYPNDDGRLTHYQKSCIDLVCNVLPTVITTDSRCWRMVARVELWRKKPWAALECHEKAFRAVSSRPELSTNESIWNEAVDACSDLAAAYESLGELPGKHNAGDVVCQDWKYKARTSVRSLMSKGRDSWEDSEGWYKLKDLKDEFAN